MEIRRGQSASGKNEGAQRLESLVVVITRCFEGGDVSVGDAQRRVLGLVDDRGAEIGPDIEQIVLNGYQQRPNVVSESWLRGNESQ